MCTAITYKADDFYFGRTLDYEHSFGESIVITPRNFIFDFRDMGIMQKHYAIIGMAVVKNDYPLYFDAVNEKGLCVAGLNFVGNAFYDNPTPLKDNIAHFEFIPWILGQCSTIKEVYEKLENINISNIPFSQDLPTAKLHWIIADKSGSITVEAVKDGVKIYVNPVGVLTNNPTFPEQLFNLNNYMNLSTQPPKNKFHKTLKLEPYSRGMGALGLPGDTSSASRFVRASFLKLNCQKYKTEEENLSQFFHILESVNVINGCSVTENGDYDNTIYTSCINADKGIYYYTTYQNRQISAIDMNCENLDDYTLLSFPLKNSEKIFIQNKK